MQNSALLDSRRFARLVTTASVAAVLSIAHTSVAAAEVTAGQGSFNTASEYCKINVTPPAADVQTGTQHTVAATLMSTGVVTPLGSNNAFDSAPSGDDVFIACVQGNLAALEGAMVKFTIVSGPNAGSIADVALNANGQAFFSYTSQLTGSDSIEASIALPDICVPAYDNNTPLDELDDRARLSANYCDTTTETLRASGAVNWVAAPSAPVVAATKSPDPTLRLSRVKRCVKNSFTIKPTYTGGQIESSSLFVNGRRIQVLTDQGESFRINGSRFAAGRHNFEVVTVFADGRAASKFGTFTRCAVKSRVVKRHVSPRFTG